MPVAVNGELPKEGERPRAPMPVPVREDARRPLQVRWSWSVESERM